MRWEKDSCSLSYCQESVSSVCCFQLHPYVDRLFSCQTDESSVRENSFPDVRNLLVMKSGEHHKEYWCCCLNPQPADLSPPVMSADSRHTTLQSPGGQGRSSVSLQHRGWGKPRAKDGQRADVGLETLWCPMSVSRTLSCPVDIHSTNRHDLWQE